MLVRYKAGKRQRNLRYKRNSCDIPVKSSWPERSSDLLIPPLLINQKRVGGGALLRVLLFEWFLSPADNRLQTHFYIFKSVFFW